MRDTSRWERVQLKPALLAKELDTCGKARLMNKCEVPTRTTVGPLLRSADAQTNQSDLTRMEVELVEHVSVQAPPGAKMQLLRCQCTLMYLPIFTLQFQPRNHSQAKHDKVSSRRYDRLAISYNAASSSAADALVGYRTISDVQKSKERPHVIYSLQHFHSAKRFLSHTTCSYALSPTQFCTSLSLRPIDGDAFLPLNQENSGANCMPIYFHREAVSPPTTTKCVTKTRKTCQGFYVHFHRKNIPMAVKASTIPAPASSHAQDTPAVGWNCDAKFRFMTCCR